MTDPRPERTPLDLDPARPLDLAELDRCYAVAGALASRLEHAGAAALAAQARELRRRIATTIAEARP